MQYKLITTFLQWRIPPGVKSFIVGQKDLWVAKGRREREGKRERGGRGREMGEECQ